MTSVLDLALELADGGLPVFPCNSHDKRPATNHGFHDATRDPADIRKWYWTGHLIGVPTGPTTSLSVLDIDPRHNGDEWLEQNLARLPYTRVHSTRSGGFHFLFRHRDGVHNSSGAIAPGVDVRGEGGYIIWWPAHDVDVVVDAQGDDIPPWPDWLVPPRPSYTYQPPDPGARASGEQKRYARAALNHAVHRVAFATEGRRNQTLNNETLSLMRFVVDGVLDAQTVADSLARAAVQAGLAEREIAGTLASAMRAGWHHHNPARPGEAQP